ncbi:MFS transporter [Pseudomonas sp. LS44]|uniref:MFS transporter n=1 Tax=Pseudomonas sp. LS44 TaxID=1357074 RepID=UPI00215A99E6|nr:MFS transporter [Pseudomonas sp. LS44]UVE19527.1 MFS transporter [Pseudomonas sp. LS44]
MSSQDSAQSSSKMPLLPIIGIVMFSFLGYLCTGIPLAVLPAYVDQTLGYGSVLAGLTIGLQYFATLLCRPIAGRIADTNGCKRGVVYGLIGIGVSGLLTLLATFLHGQPLASLLILLTGRIALGAALSIIGVSALSWGIARAGTEHTAQVISLNGVAAYGAIGLGAPLGVIFVDHQGLWTLGASLALLAVIGLLMVWPKRSEPVIAGERLPFIAALGRVFPYGCGLALGSIGYGTLTAFVTLYYASLGWDGAAYCLTAFGVFFIAARLLFTGSINRWGGFRVAIICLGIETLGLVLLWLAPSTSVAVVGASLAGFGLSLVYPALGMEVIGRIPASSRSAGLGAYAVFFDLALAIAGPLMGVVARGYGYASIFLISALLSFAGLLLSVWLARTKR